MTIDGRGRHLKARYRFVTSDVALTGAAFHLSLSKGHEKLPPPKGHHMQQLPHPQGTAEIGEMTRGTQPRSGAQSTYTAAATIQRAALPAVLDVPQAARLLGIGRTLAYELIRTNQWPTPVIRMGRLIKIPSGPIVELMTTGAAAPRQTAS
jgi:predicted DNA-binding transcriptional regulator AlpA